MAGNPGDVPVSESEGVEILDNDNVITRRELRHAAIGEVKVDPLPVLDQLDLEKEM